MKGGMEFVDDNFTEIGKLKLDGENEQNYTKKYVKTHSKIKDDTPLKFTLYNIESFNKYSSDEKFELSNLINDFDNIEHIFLCGFLTKLTRKELFIKKNIQNNNKENYKEIGRILYDIYNNKKESEKIQIILVHSSDYNALYIIFNMSNINSIYYDMLKNNLSTELFRDDKELMKKVTNTQLESLIEFTNEKLNIESKAIEEQRIQEDNKENKPATAQLNQSAVSQEPAPKNKTEFLLKLLLRANKKETRDEEVKIPTGTAPVNKTEFLLKLLSKNKTEPTTTTPPSQNVETKPAQNQPPSTSPPTPNTNKPNELKEQITQEEQRTQEDNKENKPATAQLNQSAVSQEPAPKNKTEFLLKLLLRANERGKV